MWSDVKRTPGTIVIPKIGTTDHLRILHPPQPIYIIREATHEEWSEDVKANGGNPSYGPFPYYYKVSMD